METTECPDCGKTMTFIEESFQWECACGAAYDDDELTEARNPNPEA